MEYDSQTPETSHLPKTPREIQLYLEQGPAQKLNLPYHNWEHVLNVAQGVETLAGECGIGEEAKDLLKIAALYHDLGYVEGAAGHEERSATLAASDLKSFGFSAPDIHLVTSLIRATKGEVDSKGVFRTRPKGLFEAIICDADLKFLGDTDFWNQSVFLKREFGVINEQEWLMRQLALLRFHKYHTDVARNLWGKNKKNNERLIATAIEGREDLKRYQIISELAQKYFEGTALVESRSWAKEDVEKVKQFLLAIAPFAHPNIWPNFWEYIVITSLMARLYAEKLADDSILDPHEAEVIGLLHDAGKIIRPRYLRPNFIEEVLFRRVSVRPEVLEKFASAPAILGLPPRSIKDLGNVPVAQMVQDITDCMGKLTVNGELRTWEDAARYATEIMSKLYSAQGLIWASETAGIHALDTPSPERSGKTGAKFAADLLLNEIKFLKERYGIDFEEVRHETEGELEKPENQEFILQLKAAQRVSVV